MKEMPYLIIVSLTLLMACQGPAIKTPTDMPQDPHSFAEPEQARVTHLNWDATIDFSNQVIRAQAQLRIEKSDDASALTLDTRDLYIKNIWLDDGVEADWKLGEKDPYLGRPLIIQLLPNSREVTIAYETDPGAAALQWLDPVQTAGKEMPFLFTQSQAILARTWVPIQDSPGIRFTYSAQVKVPEGMLAVMSATNPMEKNDSGIYSFKMDQPIPAYLLALAAGDLTFAPVSSRAGVYAEPQLIEEAAYEFAEMDEMIATAEGLYGAYRWDRFDLLVLPPSFPFGGMENPRITFATPTIITGDRSLTSLVAHELAHSWSGNLVTNATWNDFWLNEGFTVYFEFRIMEALYGHDYAEMLAVLETQELKQEVEEFFKENKKKDTHLKLDLKGRDPDDGLNSIAYVKGYLFLRYLESKAGREAFDRFLRDYFDRNAFQTMDTESFLEQVQQHLLDKENLDLNQEDLHSWVYGPGIPQQAVLPESNRFERIDRLQHDFLENNQAIDTTGWSTHEWLHFIRSLAGKATKNDLEKIDAAFSLTQSSNAEIQAAWYKLAIETDYQQVMPSLQQFLVNTGRRKFLMPLYKALKASEDGKEKALDIYKKARPNYHFVSVQSIDELLDYQPDEA